MTAKTVRELKIEDPEETHPGNPSDLMTQWKGEISRVLSGEPSVTTIGAKMGGNPAFIAWADGAAKGEKLPRGRYFRMRERLRAFRTFRTTFTTLHTG